MRAIHITLEVIGAISVISGVSWLLCGWWYLNRQKQGDGREFVEPENHGSK